MAVKFHERIAIRLSLSIVITVLVTAGAVATLILHDEQLVLQEDLRIRALQLGEIMSRQVLEPLLYEEDYKIHEILSSYLASGDLFLVYSELYDEKGEKILVREKGTSLQQAISFSEYGQCHNDGCAIKRASGSCIMPKEGLFAKVLHGGALKKGDTIHRVVTGDWQLPGQS